MTDEEFYQFCQDNPDLRIERNPQQEIIIMSPTGSLSGYLNNIISSQLFPWNQKEKLGKILIPLPDLSYPTAPIVRLMHLGFVMLLRID